LALDRQSIEKRDFPIGRRGYEPASVDAHLAKVAREVEALQRSARSAPATAAAPSAAPAAGASLASIASAQVQAIVEAAETSAASIEREAREQAAEVEQDAAREAQRIRDEAIARSQDHVGKVHEATALMLQRVDAMEGELGALVESLRTGANRLSADLSLLSGNMGELYTAAGHAGPVDGLPTGHEPPAYEPSAYEPSAYEPSAYEPEPEPEPEIVIVEEVEVIALLDEEPQDDEPLGAEPAAGAQGDDDVEGARLIALNMALNGQTREETDKYLAENFDLSDRATLLDEVYATVEG
jgi:DivIVA domain-containing protein